MLERGIVSRILFPAPRPSYTAESFPRELIWVPKRPVPATLEDSTATAVESNEDVPCLLLTYPSARFLIIFFHSNAEDLGWCRGFCCYLREQFQVHVLAVEYPGYGICSGIPCGKTVMENALAAFRFARVDLQWPLDSIKVFGRSIGTGPAMGLASLFDVSGLILVTPFLSVQELFRERIGPLARLIEEWFANKEIAPTIRCPTMIIHGQRDELISCRHGESLFNLLSVRKVFVSPPDMEHNTNLLTNLQFFVLPMFQFFALPDYVFQDMDVPDWAYQRPCAGSGAAIADSGSPQPDVELPTYSRSLGDSIPEHEDDDIGVVSEAQDAIRKLEEFAGTLCANEICSDGLCALQDFPEEDDELRRQETALQEIIAARQQFSHCRPSNGQAPTAPRFLSFKQHSASDLDAMWERWCKKDQNRGEEVYSEEPSVMTSMRSAAPRPRRPSNLAPDRGLRKQRGADVPQRHCQQATVWARWCGLNSRIGPVVDMHEADTNDIEGVRHRMQLRTATGRIPGWAQRSPSRGPVAPRHAPCKPPFPEAVAQPGGFPEELEYPQNSTPGCDAFLSQRSPTGDSSQPCAVMAPCCHALPSEMSAVDAENCGPGIDSGQKHSSETVFLRQPISI